jgi:hypothetical protein
LPIATHFNDGRTWQYSIWLLTMTPLGLMLSEKRKKNSGYRLKSFEPSGHQQICWLQ